MPAVREDDTSIQIDMKRGEWPYIQFQREENGELIVYIDCNRGGQVMGTGAGLAAVKLSPKKARRIQEFLERTES